ncbi:unnamed protein product [Camellia sinensis]
MYTTYSAVGQASSRAPLEAKVTAIQEAKDLTKLGIEELIGSLMAHELSMMDGSKKEAIWGENDGVANLCLMILEEEESTQYEIYTKEALDVNAKLLEANPEYLTAWNYRKFAVEHILSHSETDTEIDPDSIKSIYSEELRVLFVAALKNRSDEEELHFTTDLINEKFSNYSSWHNCSVILSHLLEKRAQGSFSKEKVLTEEYDLVHQALFTNPDDQSGWFYHLWLLEQTVKVENPLLVLPGHLVVLILMYQQMVSWILVLHLLSQLKFPSLGNLLIQPHGSQHAEMESAEMISWGDENFHTGETHLQEPTQIKNFDQLRNSEVNESASKWSAETIVNEIALSGNCCQR